MKEINDKLLSLCIKLNNYMKNIVPPPQRYGGHQQLTEKADIIIKKYKELYEENIRLGNIKA